MASERRVALVTGGAKRVGRAIVEKLKRARWNVIFTYYSSADESQLLDATLNDDQGQMQRVVRVLADLTDLDTYAYAIQQAVERLGGLDLLVNNASRYQPDPAKFDSTFAREMFSLHVETPLRLAELFSSSLRKNKGHIVNMLDLLAERPWPQYKTYCASKAALSNLTLSLARELAPEVTVNGIAPGVVEWPPDYPQAEREKYLKRVPLARAGTPQDVANLVHFLATEGSYITGQIIRLDGGRSIT